MVIVVAGEQSDVDKEFASVLQDFILRWDRSEAGMSSKKKGVHWFGMIHVMAGFCWHTYMLALLGIVDAFMIDLTWFQWQTSNESQTYDISTSRITTPCGQNNKRKGLCLYRPLPPRPPRPLPRLICSDAP